MPSSTDSEKVFPETYKHQSKAKSCSCLNITKLIIAALPSIAFGVFTIIFSIQQNSAARENRRQDQQQAEEKSIRSTYENYINDISGLLLNRKFNKSNHDHLLHIRIKTMSVLRHVDASRKRDIIWFLYESHLLRSNIPENERLSLNGSDLSNVQFIGKPAALLQLSYLYLPSVFAPNIVFESCNIQEAVFNNAFMPNAKIVHSIIYNASFYQIHAPGLILGDLILFGNNFQGAILQRTEFSSGIDIFGFINLRNADLLDSFRADKSITNGSILTYYEVDLRNARLFDGSFGLIDNSNLVIDGTAEETCQLKKNQTHWFIENFTLLMEKDYEVHSSPTSELGNCSFVVRTMGRTRLGQYIDIHLFSTLVDIGEAAYNLSVYAGCVGQESNEVKIQISCFKENLLSMSKHQVTSTMSSPHQWTNTVQSVPVETRLILIEFFLLIGNSSGYCIIDNVKLNILHNKTRTFI